MNKKHLQKKLFACALIGMTMAFVGCGKANNSNNVENETKSKKESTLSKIYTFETEEADYEGIMIPRKIEIEIVDGEKAIYRFTTMYQDRFRITEEYDVKYVKTDEEIRIDYTDAEYEGDSFSGVFKLKDDKIVSKYQKSSLSIGLEAIADTYTGTSDTYGDMEMVIEDGGDVKLTTSKAGVFTGVIYRENDGKWETNLYSSEVETSLDWYISFEGNTFTYLDYYESRYGEFAGEYKALGDLGTINFEVTSQGEVLAVAEIEGEKMDFKGRIYIDEDMGIILGMFITSMNNYTLDLEFNEIEPGVFNYYGQISKPLAAG